MNEFSKAFNGEDEEEMMPVDEAMTEDDATGDSDTPAAAVVIDAEEAVDTAAEEMGAPSEEEMAAEATAEGEPVAEEQAEMASPEGDMDDGEEMSPEDMHRQKSWEGRLKKREEELAAREASMSPAESNEEVDAIKAKLSDDFGAEFVDMICKVVAAESRNMAGGALNEAITPINQTIAQAIADVESAFKSLHFSAIADAHEDFQEIVNSDEFGAFIDGLSPEDQEAAGQIIQSGSPKQVIGLLNKYKESMNQTAEADTSNMDAAMDAAEGVRGSSPVTLPNRVPVGGDDEYKAAWNSM